MLKIWTCARAGIDLDCQRLSQVTTVLLFEVVGLTKAEALGERQVIEIILKQLEKAPNMPVPFGDDVSAIKLDGENLVVVKTDMLVGETDVPSCMTLWQAARKAVVMNVSDFAAKGVKPQGMLVSLGIPKWFEDEDIEQIGRGLNSAAREYGVYVLGGDTSETRDLIISVAMFGSARKQHIILRSGARPGDIVATTGEFGLASSGLKLLTEKLAAPPSIRGKLVDAVLMPHARLEEGLAMAETGAVTASVDSSDGLAWSLHEISRVSNVGFLVDVTPIAEETHKFADLHNLDALKLGLYGGEEYELIVTVKRREWRRFKRSLAEKGFNLIKIGETTKKKILCLKQKGRMSKIYARGYEHFKREAGN